MERNQTSVIESSDSDIKKLMTSAVPETEYKKNHQNTLSMSLKVKKVTGTLLIFSQRKLKPIHFLNRDLIQCDS